MMVVLKCTIFWQGSYNVKSYYKVNNFTPFLKHNFSWSFKNIFEHNKYNSWLWWCGGKYENYTARTQINFYTNDSSVKTHEWTQQEERKKRGNTNSSIQNYRELYSVVFYINTVRQCNKLHIHGLFCMRNARFSCSLAVVSCDVRFRFWKIWAANGAYKLLAYHFRLRIKPFWKMNYFV